MNVIFTGDVEVNLARCQPTETPATRVFDASDSAAAYAPVIRHRAGSTPLLLRLAVPNEASKLEAFRPDPGCGFFPVAAARLDARWCAAAVAPALPMR